GAEDDGSGDRAGGSHPSSARRRRRMRVAAGERERERAHDPEQRGESKGNPRGGLHKPSLARLRRAPGPLLTVPGGDRGTHEAVRILAPETATGLLPDRPGGTGTR